MDVLQMEDHEIAAVVRRVSRRVMRHRLFDWRAVCLWLSNHLHIWGCPRPNCVHTLESFTFYRTLPATTEDEQRVCNEALNRISRGDMVPGFGEWGLQAVCALLAEISYPIYREQQERLAALRGDTLGNGIIEAEFEEEKA